MATQAYEFLEAAEPGGYERMLNDLYDCGGTLVENPEFFLAFVVRERVAMVVFACGNLRKLLAFAHANKAVFGYEAVEWARQLCGNKHKSFHRYSMKQLRR